MKYICIALLLFVVSSLAAPEEKKAVVQYSAKSSDWEHPERIGTQDAPKVYDGILDNWEATSTRDNQPFFAFTLLNYPVYTTYVEIVNRADCCQERIDPFTVFITSKLEDWDNKSVDYYKSVGTYSNWRDVSGTASTYRVPFPNVLTFWSRIQQHDRDYMNIAEVSFIQLYRPPYLGSASSSVYAATNPRAYAFDSNPNTWFATDNEAFPWFEVWFPAQKICRVTIWNRYESCCSSRINPFTVALKNGNFTARTGTSTVPLVQNYCSNEAGITCSTSQTGVQEIYEVDFSTEPVADRARIFQQTPGYLNFAEIQVYACNFPANFHYEMK